MIQSSSRQSWLCTIRTSNRKTSSDAIHQRLKKYGKEVLGSERSQIELFRPETLREDMRKADAKGNPSAVKVNARRIVANGKQKARCSKLDAGSFKHDAGEREKGTTRA